MRPYSLVDSIQSFYWSISTSIRLNNLTLNSHEVSDNGIYYTTLEAVKTSCSKKTMWLPTIKSNTDVNIIDPTLDFEYCPFCGCDISNNKGNFYNWQNIETVATKMSLQYDTLMQEKDNPTAKQSFELDVFRSWGGLETNDSLLKNGSSLLSVFTTTNLLKLLLRSSKKNI